MKPVDKLSETIYGLFSSVIRDAGFSLPTPGRIEDIRRTSSKLSKLIVDRIKEETIVLINVLQTAIDEGFNSIEAENEELLKRVEILDEQVNILTRLVKNNDNIVAGLVRSQRPGSLSP